MFNVGTGELLVILLLALIVLGPEKLPDAARKMGNIVSELRRMSGGLQAEMRSAMDEITRPPLESVKDAPAAESAPDEAPKDETGTEPAKPHAAHDDPAA
ncbi:MAG TPA: Sec-independent protein translocase protein TatB [Acidimicrobiales bacterium]|jgi:Tat protein translocase TatB subunit|nr:Sec-independent protein translocase protein TatB [Acidimicrobiales bacterium]